MRCLEVTPSICPYIFSVGSACFCESPFRLDIAKMSYGMTEQHWGKEVMEETAGMTCP